MKTFNRRLELRNFHQLIIERFNQHASLALVEIVLSLQHFDKVSFLIIVEHQAVHLGLQVLDPAMGILQLILLEIE